VLKEFVLFWNDKVAVMLTFIVPIALIYVFGSIFSGDFSGSAEIRMAFLNESGSAIGKKLEKALDTSKTFVLVKTFTDENGRKKKFDASSIKEFVKNGKISSALVIPSDAVSDTSPAVKLKFYYDPKNDIEMQLTQGMLQKIVMESVPDIFQRGMMKQSEKFLGRDTGKVFNKELAKVVGKYFKIAPEKIISSYSDSAYSASNDSGKRKGMDFFSNILQLEKEQLVGKEIKNPNVTRNIGGTALMFLLFALTGASTSLFDEKKSGVMLRLLSAPVSPQQILWSKYIHNMLLGIVQLLALFIAGMLMFRVDIFSNFFNLLVVIIAGAAACTAFGMLLAAFCKTSAQASAWGTFLILTMSAIGGAWFPSFLLPKFIQTLSKGTIVFWTVDGFIQTLWRGAALKDILPNIAFLFGVAGILNALSIWKFRKTQL
jgi:ABC-2 type transport system permease protein